jgi:hypothetical protein
VFNDIIKTCVKINTNSEQGAGWAQINSWDRFWFVLKVREYTYNSSENTIDFTDDCSECNTEIKYELKSSSLFYEFPVDDLIDKYWDGENSHSVVRDRILAKDFTIQGTKYMAVDFNVSMSEYLDQIAFLVGLIIDSGTDIDDFRVLVPAYNADLLVVYDVHDQLEWSAVKFEYLWQVGCHGCLLHQKCRFIESSPTVS